MDCYLTPAITSQAKSCGAAAAHGDGRRRAVGAPRPRRRAANCWFGNVPPGATTADYVAGLGRLVLGLVVVYVLGALTGGLMFFADGLGRASMCCASCRSEVFDHLHELSLGYYSRNESGDLMSRITNDTSTIQQAIGFALVNVLSGG